MILQCGTNPYFNQKALKVFYENRTVLQSNVKKNVIILRSFFTQNHPKPYNLQLPAPQFVLPAHDNIESNQLDSSINLLLPYLGEKKFCQEIFFIAKSIKKPRM